MEDFAAWRRFRGRPEAVETYRRLVQEKNDEIGAFISLDADKLKSLVSAEEKSSEERNGDGGSSQLNGVPFGVKDNIAVEGLPLTCGSKMLEHFTSPYDAGAIRRLADAGAVPVGKTNLDEFGMGSTTEESALGSTYNPWDRQRVPGGSSGGSAAAVAAGMVPFALGTDTGGSVRQPAAFCGVYGLKPTYGSVSRFGLVAYASSLEVIGVLAGSVDWAREVFTTMRGRDPLDQSSAEYPPSNASPADPGSQAGPAAPAGNGNFRVGVLSGDLGLSEPVQRVYEKSIENLSELGFEVESVDLPILDYAIPAYYTIATAEASANLARYAGVRYGYRSSSATDFQDTVRLSRNEAFGDEVKTRILLGTYVLRSGFQDQYYIKAQKIRTALKRTLDELFERVDLLYMPVYPVNAFPRGEEGLTPFQQKLADKFTATANMAGIPALSFPAGYDDGLPVGMQFMAPVFQEERLFAAASRYAETFPPRTCPGKLEWE
ncbi:MAG: Asp-tRNA(Asn)/Glu-tRNA(Gln) amidotransferase subunit GatA [Spirochaetota bacterium]